MEPERWQKVKALFEAASALAPDKRDKFLSNACSGDGELEQEVRNLLVSLDDAETFLEQPAAAEALSLFEDKQTAIGSQTTGEIDGGNFVAGTILAGRYRILGLLGKGGMGEVFKAEDIKLNQTVALKFLPDKLEKDKGALERFHGEVRNARQVSHQNVCRVFDIGEIEGRHFLSMEFIDGDDLSSLLKRIGRLPSDKAVEIARQLCFGLAAIHDAGILHRDLKPANVIIDSRGKARITDFGIAGIEKELGAGEIRVGTPAYMSPEQITGREVTQRSDIYALGLLLYEIFTGKQTFKADSVDVILRQQRTTIPTNPSEILKEIDPIVEKTILQCLQKNAEDRPKNALQVAMMLPGGNPLEAAIAAGETPSPEMVAAAPKKGALRPAVAVACLVSVVLLLGFIVAFSGIVKMTEWIPFEKSPEILAERANSFVKKLGYASASADSAYGFAANESDYYKYAATEQLQDPWAMVRTGQPALVYFWHRTSPRYLEPLRSETVKANDPSNDVAAMTRVYLDTRGRLLEFQAIPPQVKEVAVPGEVDWAALFTEAGLDIRRYRLTEANWNPPVLANEVVAWEGPHVDHSDITVRIEAAAFQGRAVHFQIVAPWDKPLRQEEALDTPSRRAAGVILILVFISVVVAGVFLARRNLKEGRSDASGALKISVFVFLLSMAAGLLVADHIPDLTREYLILLTVTSDALFAAAVMGLLYLALEPFVRRRWANLIISWSRLLAGDFRDPLVGRDILVGGILGLIHTCIIYLGFLVPYWTGNAVAPNPGGEVSSLQGVRYLLSSFLLAPIGGVVSSFGVILLLILLVTIFRKQWIATVALWILASTVLGLAFAGRPSFALIGTAAIATIMVLCVSRFGLLATFSFQFFFTLSFHQAISTKFGSWYFINTVFIVILLLGVAAYSFYISLAKQPIFPGKILRDD